jgi:hypothetical protein
MTGVRISVVTHVSAIVWPASAREALAVPRQAPHGSSHASAAAAHASPSS